MRMKANTTPSLFIIESLTFRDEERKRFEGSILSDILALSGKNDVKYFYIRTEKELKAALKKFAYSEYRYLHISCHGDRAGIGLTLDSMSFEEFAQTSSRTFKSVACFFRPVRS